MNNSTLSVAYTVRNEEKTIIKSLISVYDLAHEIIIIDGSSTDKTVNIIREFDIKKKIKIFVEPHEPMFHKNKQKAIERCTGDWILQLDADEIVTEDLRSEIDRNLLREIDRNLSLNQPAAYNIPRLNYFMGKPLRKGGQFPDYTIRLYRNGIARFPCKSVHEQVEINIKYQKSNIKNLQSISTNLNKSQLISVFNSPLLHYPYPTFNDYLIKWKRYNQLEAEKLRAEGFKMNLKNSFLYLIWYPKYWFFKVYFRHLGFLDGVPGFVFAFFTAIRFWGIYYSFKNVH